MANFALLPAIGNTSTITATLVSQYGVSALSRPNAATASCSLLAYTPNTTLKPVYSFWYIDSSYDIPLACFISFSDNSYCAATIPDGSSATPNRNLINNSGVIDGVSYWFNSGRPFETGWWMESLSEATPYNSIIDGVRDILTNTSYVTISYVSGVVSVTAPKLAVEGSTVTAYLAMPNGVIVNESDIGVTKNGTSIPFTYANGVLTFTA